MEHFIRILVKLIAFDYVMHRLWLYLFACGGPGIWRFLFPVKGKKEKKQDAPPQWFGTDDGAESVVGTSRTVYMEEPVIGKPPLPVRSESLEREEPPVVEPDIDPDDVEYIREELTPEDLLDDEERFYIPQGNAPVDDGLSSTGTTFGDIAGTLGVVQGRTTDSESRMAAARTLYDVRHTDLFLFFAAQAANEEVIDRLFKENLDGEGKPLSRKPQKRKKNPVEEFDMKKYIC